MDLLENTSSEEVEELLQYSNEDEENEIQDEYAKYNETLYGTPYIFNYKGLQRKVKKGNTEEYKTLSNFLPIPLKKIYKDDGMESEGLLEIEGVLYNHEKLPKIIVNYKKLENMLWLFDPKWNLRGRIYPPKSNHKEYVYDAIQTQCDDIPEETIFEHTGFRKVNNKWVYLHQGGAIGTDKNISVDLSDIGLEKYKFTDKNYEIKDCLQTSLSLMDLAKREITIPLFATTYLSPLRSIFTKQGIPLGFVTWIVGESGSQKSSISALFGSHFGDFERDTLPGGFKDTANSIEKKAFILKDTLFLIDDYYPSQTLQETKKMDSVAESLFGLYGDRQARSRMRQDGKTVKMGYSARGMCLVTGESFPTFAESRTARAFIIEIARGDIDLNLLSLLQKAKEKLSFVMKSYILYIIENIDKIEKECKNKFTEYRNKANAGMVHGRIPEIVASEYMAMELIYEFACNKGVITEEQKIELQKEAWNTLISAARLQSMRTQESRTDNMFFMAVQELLASKKIYLKSYKNHGREPDESLSTFVGYYDEIKERCYLLPNVIFNEVVKFYAIQGTKFPGNEKSTWKYLREAGRLFATEKDRNKVRKSIDGKLITVVEVKASDVFGEYEFLSNEDITKFETSYTENHSKNLSIYDDMELPF